ncbi:hypothetical protein ACNI3Q_02790 [Sphingomonas sp. FW199]|uniref:hypothetical protein n=1 Tax=Sphingomonas sp. FW199 TaxID=3400217 RepID=UPI003CEA1A23
MTRTVPAPPARNDAAEAFEALRREVSLLHSAIEGLSAARERTPDYSTTLGNIQKELAATSEALGRIEDSPAVQLTPADMGHHITRAATDVRAEDRRIIVEAHGALKEALGRVDGIAIRARSTEVQRQREVRIGGGAFLAGILLWSFLPGTVARALPESWHVPEWMAARMMGMDEAEAGARLIEVRKKASVEDGK